MPCGMGSATNLLTDNFNTGGGVDLHQAIGLYFAGPAGHLIVSALNPLPVTGVLSPSAFSNNTNSAALSAGVPYTVTFTPAADHTLQYITARMSGLDAGSSITVTISFIFAAGAGFTTIFTAATFAADGAGRGDFAKCFESLGRNGGDGITIDITTTSVGAGTANVVETIGS